MCIFVCKEDSTLLCSSFCTHEHTCEDSSKFQEVAGYNPRDYQSHLQMASMDVFLQANVVVRLQNGSLTVNRKMAAVQHSSQGKDIICRWIIVNAMAIFTSLPNFFIFVRRHS